MTTITSLLKAIAAQLEEQQPSDALRKWMIRGEIPSEEVDENKTLIAVLHLNSQEEVVKFNYTFRLNCSLTGQILINEMGQSELIDEAHKIWVTLNEYLRTLQMKSIEDTIVLQAVAHGVETSIDGYYVNFSVPIEIYAQF